MGKFEDNVDLIDHLEDLKRSWNEVEFGKFDCDLMEVAEGVELGASAFFNGHQFLENRDGKVVGYLDFEEKKEADGGLGETCGEMGTAFLGVSEDNKLFKRILLRPAIIDKLRDMDFRGVFNINCILTDDGRLVALEPTMRFGIPATSYECVEGLISDTGELLETLAKGLDRTIDIHLGVGMVMCVVAKPFPLEVDVEPLGTSVGEKLWFLGQSDQPIERMSENQMSHIHLYNFTLEDKIYKVASKNGYLLTVTKKGMNVKIVRTHLIDYIKSNLFISGMKFRSDIGKRVEQFIEDQLN
jgi:hypothetical protein